MSVSSLSRFISRHKQIVLVTTIGFLFLFSFDNIFSVLYPLEDDSSYLHGRSKREIYGPDPLNPNDYPDGTLFTEAELTRFGRKILNESESYFEENGSKRPIPLKKLNEAYAEAKRLYFAKKNCQERPSTAAPPPGEEGGEAAPPAEEGRRRRRRRGAIERTTERVYYCDEFTTTTVAPAPTEAAPAE